ncbi:MAG: Hsp20/alpha crystallin family protein [Desulfovibrio sp.]|jgi:HSP20 family protein|nr:Hsp20/alpha crystallin family protein [Desulfovibrio sp.]
MNLIKFNPSRWFGNEDGDKSLVVRRRGDNPRDVFRSEVDRLFDSFLAPFGGPLMSPLFGSAYDGDVILKPRLDLDASDKEYVVAAELPGVDEKDVSIEVSKNTLTISGEKKKEFEDKDEKGVRHVERSYGFFQRALALPDDADIDGIKAGFSKGVLRVTIPRIEAKKDTRKVEITKD